MMRFQCPRCQKVLKAPQDCAGRKTKCTRCGQKLLVPAPLAPTAEQNKTVLGKPCAPVADSLSVQQPEPAVDLLPAAERTANCPGCGRSIPYHLHELPLDIECAVCKTCFTLQGQQAATATSEMRGMTEPSPGVAPMPSSTPTDSGPGRKLSPASTSLPFLFRFVFSLALIILFGLILLVGTVSGGDSKTDSMFSFVADKTSEGISPLMDLGVQGCWRYCTEKDSDKLGFFEHPLVFGAFLCVALLVFVKDHTLTFLGPLKAPLSALAALVHSIGGMIGLVHTFLDGCSLAASYQSDSTLASVTHYSLIAVVVLMTLFVYLIVFLMFNVIEAVIVVNPFPLVESGLKTFRSAIIVGVLGLNSIHPVLGFLASMVIFLIGLQVVHFSTRCTVLSLVYSTGILRRLFGRTKATGLNDLRAFSSWNFRGVPLFTYGRFRIGPDGTLNFVYNRLFLFWERAVPLTYNGLAVGIGSVNPYLVGQVGGTADRVILLFSPRTLGCEHELCRSLQLHRVTDISWITSIKNAVVFLWTVVKRPFTASAASHAV